MKKQLIFFSFLLLHFSGKGQQQYFNKRFDFNSSNENGFDILPYDIGYIAWFTVTLNPTINRHQVAVAFIDSIGDTVRTKIIDIPNRTLYLGNGGSACVTNDNGYAIAGSIADTNGNGNLLFYRFNHAGDTIWTLEYGDTAFQSGWQCKQTRDNGYIITGTTSTYDYHRDVLLLKINSSGVIQWVQHYGGMDEDQSFSVDTCIDGGFILAGRTRSFGIHPHTPFKNSYLVKTDSLGNFQWQKVFGAYLDDAFWYTCSGFDSSVYAFGYYGFAGDSLFCCSQFNKPHAVKLDLTGNIIWEKFYGDSLYDMNPTSAELLSDGTFIIGGLTGDTTCYKSFILKIDSDGDSLLYRTYRGLQGLYSHSFFLDVSADRDAGYICTGWVGPSLPDTGDNDIWILKLDSNGCEAPNCFWTSLYESQSIYDQYLSIYPNPSSTSTTLEVKLQDAKDCMIQLTDFLGRIVREFQIENGNNKITINVGTLQPGLYIVNLYSKGEKISLTQLIITE